MIADILGIKFYDKDLVSLVAKKEIAEKESCVIIGRCADYILRDFPNLVKIFIYSNDEDKILI